MSTAATAAEIRRELRCGPARRCRSPSCARRHLQVSDNTAAKKWGLSVNRRSTRDHAFARAIGDQAPADRWETELTPTSPANRATPTPPEAWVGGYAIAPPVPRSQRRNAANSTGMLANETSSVQGSAPGWTIAD